IDHFKRINDEFGHQAGDQVLARLAGLLTSHCRSSDIICRYGGEEFVVLMPEVTIGAAVERADAIRLAFTGLKMRFNNRDLAPTLSVGIAACPLHATSGDRPRSYRPVARRQAFTDRPQYHLRPASAGVQ